TGDNYNITQSPDWINAGLNYANQPLVNQPITAYGRWNWNGGATNGMGMGASPWPSPQSITQPYGPPPTQPQMGQPTGDNFPGITPQQPPGGSGVAQNGAISKGQAMLNAGVRSPGGMGLNGVVGQMTRQPGMVQQAFQQFQGMNPQQQADFIHGNNGA